MQPDPGVGFLRVCMDAGALAQRQPMSLAFSLTFGILNALGPNSKEENKSDMVAHACNLFLIFLYALVFELHVIVRESDSAMSCHVGAGN